ncbi:hypothetical protein F4820DRAFT_419834 [Hypoxylon rubiginosum]|uniref:Uncharacterized protein n=1 Tax=Hypoxylon rubiginosum TaxID=110542 RepID=A0ACB9Z1F6_9PEZI|nr:hypothetical protein F4820DRAFT_419834 [Hypoxylon rubiginosum]
MSKNGGSVVKDTSLPLSQIRDEHSASIVESVLDIEKHAVTRENWLKSLECLYLAQDNEEPSVKRRRVSGGSVAVGSSELLRRRYLDPVTDAEGGRDYIAVSYTWQASEQEEEADEEAVGRYLIESRRTGEPPMASDVRDVVWNRVLNYAAHVGCNNIWIDRECVDQEDEAEQEAAIQSMHLVYSLSKKPIALLTREIETVEELDLLTDIMCGQISAEDEAATLILLDDITSNLWWTRAWTFQEDYRASYRMTLLIPHCRSLEVSKQIAADDAGLFLLGDVEGEVCIDSMEFKGRATEFCLMYRKKKPEARDVCDRILKAAAEYNILLREGSPSSLYSISRSMSPNIISDVLSRGITLESDRLAIMANCCGYGIRLDTNSLNSDGTSLSLSILALYLLNGEIIDNGRDRPNRGTLDDKIHEYLSRQSLRSFRPPIDEGLTFIKSCRFVEPRLRADGTLTSGHLWKLGKVIRRKPLKLDKYNTLLPLDMLATDLYYKDSDQDLSTRLLGWSREYSATPGNTPRPRRWGWRRWMTDEVEEALMEGKTLRLGRLVHPKYRGEDAAYRAVFVGDKDDGWDESVPSFAFTCVRPAAAARSEAPPGDTYKHVSLEVDAEFSERAPPRLYIRRWLNGLCFFEGQPQRDVLFPWPPALLEK